MTIKTSLNYSPNFNSIKRKSNQIEFIIIHYTGMKSELNAISRLTDSQSKVSSHYLIKNNGEIISIVPDLYIAWHAGRSSWKNHTSLNKNSIGIEITNPGHGSRYKKYTKKQIKSLVRVCKFLIKKYKISLNNVLGHSDIAPDRKKDPGEKFPWKFLFHKKVCMWHKLTQKVLIKNRGIKISEKKKEIFIKNLSVIGYSKKTPENLNKANYLVLVTKAFQRRYRQEIINGKIDKECLIISENLIN